MVSHPRLTIVKKMTTLITNISQLINNREVTSLLRAAALALRINNMFG